MPASDRPWLMPVMASLAACAAAALPYLSTLDGYFLGEDFGLVRAFHDKSALYFLKLFASPYDEPVWGESSGELRAFAALYYTLGALADPGSPVLQRVITLALHALTSVLAVLMARRLAGLTWGASAFAGVLFAVLPAHAEAVAWISGRVESSMTIFYALSIAAYARWRTNGAARWFALSFGAYFVALYSKESAVTLPALLLAYDWLHERGKPLSAPRAWWPYIPFVLLSAVYLALLRSPYLALPDDPSAMSRLYVASQAHCVQQLVFGTALVDGHAPPQLLISLMVAVGISIGIGVVLAVRIARSGDSGRRWVLNAFYFGPVWWLVTTAPFLVGPCVGRYLYLPSFGAAVALAILLDRARLVSTVASRIALFAAATLVLFQCIRLTGPVDDWKRAGRVSARVAAELQSEMRAAAPGTLLVVDIPEMLDTPCGDVRLWAVSMPFAIQPPYAQASLDRRVAVISVQLRTHYFWARWFQDTRHAILVWRSARPQPPILVLSWDASSGRLARKTESDLPALRSTVSALTDIRTARQMEEALGALVAPGAVRPPSETIHC